MDLFDRLNFQSTMQRQLPAPPIRVVYAASGNRTAALVVTDQSVIIEHKLYWLEAASMAEARYLEVILNSNLVAGMVGEMQSLGLFGARDIDTLPWRLAIPLYDESVALHETLVNLCVEAATIAAAEDISGATVFTHARAVIRTAITSAGVQSRIEAAVSELLGIETEGLDLPGDFDEVAEDDELE